MPLPLSLIPLASISPPKRSRRAESQEETLLAIESPRQEPSVADESVSQDARPASPGLVADDVPVGESEPAPADADDVPVGESEPAPADADDVPVGESEPAPAADAEDIIIDLERTSTLRQLRDMCLDRSLTSTGKKSELVQRIVEHDRSDTTVKT